MDDFDLPAFGAGYTPEPPDHPEPVPEEFSQNVECHPLLNGWI
jgi:hypothetical protein